MKDKKHALEKKESLVKEKDLVFVINENGENVLTGIFLERFYDNIVMRNFYKIVTDSGIIDLETGFHSLVKAYDNSSKG